MGNRTVSGYAAEVLDDPLSIIHAAVQRADSTLAASVLSVALAEAAPSITVQCRLAQALQGAEPPALPPVGTPRAHRFAGAATTTSPKTRTRARGAGNARGCVGSRASNRAVAAVSDHP